MDEDECVDGEGTVYFAHEVGSGYSCHRCGTEMIWIDED